MKTLIVRAASDGLAQVEIARSEVFNAFNQLMIEEPGETFPALGQDYVVHI